MKLLFLGEPLDAALTEGLTAQQVEVVNHETADPSVLPPEASFDLIVFAPSKLTEVEKVKELRTRFPQAWIVLLIETGWLGKKNATPTLFNLVEKDEVWLKGHWQANFLFAFQTFLKNFEVRLQRQALETESERLRVQCHELGERVEKLVRQLERDVELAASVHRSLLPKSAPEIPGVEVTVRYLPATGKGGDYYDIFEFGDRKRFGILMADSKTHGMAASLLAVLVKIRLEEMKDRFPDSKSFVEFLNQEIKGVHDKQMASLSLMYGILDRATLTFQYTCAGHLRPILCRLGEVPEITSHANPALGGVDQFSFQENTIRLQPGDQLVFFTDGWEPLLQNKASDQIKNFLKKQAASPAVGTTLPNEMMGVVDSFKETAPLPDDLTLIQFCVQDRLMYLVNK